MQDGGAAGMVRLEYVALCQTFTLNMQDDKSIEQLENDYWTDTDFPTDLVERCHKYRKIAIKDLSVEQIRTLLSQNIGLKYLLPKALEILKNNVLAEGDFYPGDLLMSVLHVQGWTDDSLKEEFKLMLTREKPNIQSLNQANQHRRLLREIDRFLQGLAAT